MGEGVADKFNFMDLVVDTTATYAEQATARMITLLVTLGGPGASGAGVAGNQWVTGGRIGVGAEGEEGGGLVFTGNLARVRGMLLKLIGIAIQFFSNVEVRLKVWSEDGEGRLKGVIIEMQISKNGGSTVDSVDTRTLSEYNQFLACKALILQMGGTLTVDYQLSDNSYHCSVFLPN